MNLKTTAARVEGIEVLKAETATRMSGAKMAAAMVEGIVPVLREYIDDALQPLGARCDAADGLLRELREQQDALRAEILAAVDERLARDAEPDDDAPMRAVADALIQRFQAATIEKALAP